MNTQDEQNSQNDRRETADSADPHDAGGDDLHGDDLHETVVAAFNLLGWQATFAAVAAELKSDITASDLYELYPNREALAEAWLARQIPEPMEAASVRSLFEKFMSALLDALDHRRDFARAWLGALALDAPTSLEQLQQMQDDARLYFCTGLANLRDFIALPPPLMVADVVDELALVLSGVAASLLLAWQADRSHGAHRTRQQVESVACLLDALLLRRAEFADTSLLVHLHRMAALPHAQFVQPLVDLLLPSSRVQRLGNAPAMVDLLRRLLPPHDTAVP